jgi:hypothetical protein
MNSIWPVGFEFTWLQLIVVSRDIEGSAADITVPTELSTSRKKKKAD